MKSVAERLNDLIIIHKQDLIGFSQSEVNRFQALIREADNEIRSYLLSADIDGPLSYLDYTTLLKGSKEIERKYKDIWNEEILALLFAFVKTEVNYYNDIIQETNEAEIELKKYEEEREKEKLLKHKVMFNNGEVISLFILLDIFSTRINNVSNVLLQTYNGKLNLQDTVAKLIGTKQLNYKDGLNYRNYLDTDANLKTALASLADESYNSVFGLNKNYVKGYRWDAILDGRTSQICLNLNSKVWFYNEPGKSTLPGEIYPPAHYRCRSVATPIIASWKELGLNDTKENRELYPEYEKSEYNYSDWFEKQSASIQKKLIGVTRYNMYKEGSVSTGKFLDLITNPNTMQLYTLKELIQRNGENLKEIGKK